MACAYSWVIFLVYEILISIQSYTAAKPLCAIVPNDSVSPFYNFSCAAAVSGFIFTFVMLSVRISQMMPGNERVPSMVALDVVLKGLLCTLVFVVFNLNGICIDVLGYVLDLDLDLEELFLLSISVFNISILNLLPYHSESALLQYCGANGLAVLRQLSS